MYYRSLINLYGLIFLASHLEENLVWTETISECDVVTDDRGTVLAKCKDKGITEIPQNLGENIHVLDISDNNITVLNKNDLKNYPNIWALFMRALPVKAFPEEFFKYTTHLRVVNISKTKIANLKELPTSVKTFNYTYCSFEYVDLSHLIHLEEIFMRDSTFLKKFPTLDKSAPLRVLDFKFCALTEANYTQLSPFCNVKYLGIYSKELKTKEYLQTCCELMLWALKFHDVYLKGYKIQGCASNDNDSSICKTLGIKLDPAAIEEYTECYQAPRIKLFFIALAAIIFFLIIVAVISTAIWYFYHTRVLMKLTQGNESESVLGNETASAEMESETDENESIE